MLITLFVYVVLKSYLYKKINGDSISTRVRVFFDTQRVDSNTHPPLTPQYRVGRSLLFRFYFKTTPFVKSLSLCILSIHIVPFYYCRNNPPISSFFSSLFYNLLFQVCSYLSIERTTFVSMVRGY